MGRAHHRTQKKAYKDSFLTARLPIFFFFLLLSGPGQHKRGKYIPTKGETPPGVEEEEGGRERKRTCCRCWPLARLWCVYITQRRNQKRRSARRKTTPFPIEQVLGSVVDGVVVVVVVGSRFSLRIFLDHLPSPRVRRLLLVVSLAPFAASSYSFILRSTKVQSL